MKKFGIILIVIISISFAQSVRADVPRKEEITKEDMLQKAKIETQAVSDECYKSSFVKKEYSTLYAINAAKKQNNCLEKAIIKEIKEVFSFEKQKEIQEILQQTRNSCDKFYESLYSENKYCYGQCGLTAQIIQQSKVTEFLEQLLYDLIVTKFNKGD